jgi:hypothetical protein
MKDATAQRLSETARNFANADEQLRYGSELESGPGIVDLAEQYLSTRAEHQKAIEEAEAEVDN